MKSIGTTGLLFLALLLMGTAPLRGQTVVRGQVTSAETQQPVAGVDVSVQGGAQSTITSEEGRYQLSVPANATLVFSSLGYSTLEVAVETRTVVDVVLEPSAVALGELVVVGYTSEVRRNVTGAVSGVQAEEIADRKVATVEQALAGRVAGVDIATSGEPGQPAAITVRGQNFLYEAEPLCTWWTVCT